LSSFPGWSAFNHEAWKKKQAEKKSADIPTLYDWVKRGDKLPSKKLAAVPTPRAGTPMYPVFEALLRTSGLSPYRTEFQFYYPARLWRFDFAWPDNPENLVALECDGGAFVPDGGRHNRGAGFLADMERSNAAVLLGWRVLRYPPAKLNEAIPELQQILAG